MVTTSVRGIAEPNSAVGKIPFYVRLTPKCIAFFDKIHHRAEKKAEEFTKRIGIPPTEAEFKVLENIAFEEEMKLAGY